MFTIYLEKDGVNVKEKPGGGGMITWGSFDHLNCEKSVKYVPITSKGYGWSFNLTAICYGNYCYNSTSTAMTDTGTSLIYGPPKEVNPILAKMGINKTDGTIPCYVCAEPVIFKIGGHEYPLYKDQVIRSENGVCYPNLQPLQDHWLLGDIFIQEYCQIYDYGNKRVGFAKIKTQRNSKGQMMKGKKCEKQH